MKREVKFEKGYNCIDFECQMKKKCTPNNSHGKRGMSIRFLVHGDKGAVQFLLSTGWYPYYSKADKIGYRSIKNSDTSGYFPAPADLGFHSYKPMYEGQTSMGKCSYLNGAECYYDGSGLNANDAYYTLVNGGEEALWKFLEQYYLCVFEDKEYPQVTEYETPLNQ
jgi:hypothetical protein